MVMKIAAWRAAAGKLSARAENVLTNHDVGCDTPQELRQNLLNRFGVGWPGELRRWHCCGVVTITEIQRWIGDNVDTAKHVCVCRTCGRKTNRSCEDAARQ